MSTRLFKSTVMLVVVAITFVALTSSAAAQEEPSEITLVLPPLTEAGVEVFLSAKLIGPDGAPVEDEEILFTAEFDFLNVFDVVDLGTATTDEAGFALLPYDPRVEGEVTIFAEFAGSRRLAPAETSGTMETVSIGQVYSELPPFHIPGANFWMAVAILSVVWLIFVVAVSLLGIGIYRGRSAVEGTDA